MTGSLIVIEGIDGSGKTTQVNLLADYLENKNISHEVINFPRYEDNLYGQLIRRYLNGEFGPINKVNPYLMALAYAGDRILAKPLIENWLSEGKIVIANRYVPSNKAHMGANLPEDKREEFMNWLDQLEYQTNKMPKENLTILLNIEAKEGQQKVSSDSIGVRGEHKDIHEQSLNHLKIAQDLYLELYKAEQNWKIVECMEDRKLKSKEEIHQLIVKIFNKFLIIQRKLYF